MWNGGPTVHPMRPIVWQNDVGLHHCRSHLSFPFVLFFHPNSTPAWNFLLQISSISHYRIPSLHRPITKHVSPTRTTTVIRASHGNSHKLFPNQPFDKHNRSYSPTQQSGLQFSSATATTGRLDTHLRPTNPASLLRRHQGQPAAIDMEPSLR